MTDKDTYYSRPEILKRRRAGRIALLLSAAMYFGATGWVEVQAADYYWSGASSTSDNIDQGDNWHTAGTPSPGDYLYFNNTSGSRHYPYSNYGAGSWFENIITYSGAGGITWKGDKTYAKKFENSDDSNLFEIQASIETETHMI